MDTLQPPIHDLILEKLNSYVTGACFPPRNEPLDCYRPHHAAHAPRDDAPAIDGIMQAAVPGAAARRVESSDGVA
ncbi:hypothetical protein LTR53_008517, partial [Teratosphaeriaceae sp. CCFEE 6253]